MMLISVVIPLFNKESSINETLNSVLNQTYKNFEIIIINDGSTDSSLEIVNKFSDSRIHIYQQENKGVSVARNLGIKYSTGELIAFLDADDYWFVNHLEELKKLHYDFPNCGMYCSRYIIKIAHNSTLKLNHGNNLKKNYRGEILDFFQASMRYRVALTSALAIPKKILTNDFMFNPKVSSGQDLELFTKIGITYKVAITNLNTVEYNFALKNQLSKTPITEKKLLKFSQFKEAEQANLSLKKYLDLYRIEYALQYKIAGENDSSKFYLNNIKKENINFKTLILLKTPNIILKELLKIKHWLRNKGIDFSVYS